MNTHIIQNTDMHVYNASLAWVPWIERGAFTSIAEIFGYCTRLRESKVTILEQWDFCIWVHFFIDIFMLGSSYNVDKDIFKLNLKVLCN